LCLHDGVCEVKVDRGACPLVCHVAVDTSAASDNHKEHTPITGDCHSAVRVGITRGENERDSARRAIEVRAHAYHASARDELLNVI